MNARSYRELVSDVLIRKHLAIEYYLRKVAEQEGFIAAVAEKLSRTSWIHCMNVDRHFDVTFVLQPGWIGLPHQKQAVRQHLETAFDVVRDGDTLIVTDHRKNWLQCRVVFGGEE